MTNEQLLIILLALHHQLELAVMNYKVDNPGDGREVSILVNGFESIQKSLGADTKMVFDKIQGFENVLLELDTYIETLRASAGPLVDINAG